MIVCSLSRKKENDGFLVRTCVVILSLLFLIGGDVKQQLLKLNILKSQDYSAYIQKH